MRGVKRSLREPIVLEFSRSSRAYRQRLGKPVGLVWARPGQGLNALAEALPFEALLVSGAAAIVLCAKLGDDLGGALSLGVALALVTLQMLRERTYATASRLVHQRGLFFLSREETDFRAVRQSWVEGEPDLGDIVLAGEFGERRIRAVTNPHEKLERLRELVKCAMEGAA